ncbi:hypothetical protein PCC7424_0700 [Gloeothece citriformis PCC 7424]|uniref:Uncharacterized protein n=1 Tax=Gloeothece citriformis (strain PCC 7424) TaxID=65393 RepID=B7KFW3_GLOC7|nr:hypothetical protein [Gloeothece citriformis]ACK69156.1 hypothetical protein PCC7424_0700 [Gloeothece citriformis PCC 7424]
MESIHLKSKVDAEGKLTIQLPQELANQELDLVIVYQLLDPKNFDELHTIVEQFYGCLADAPILVDEDIKEDVA